MRNLSNIHLQRFVSNRNAANVVYSERSLTVPVRKLLSTWNLLKAVHEHLGYFVVKSIKISNLETYSIILDYRLHKVSVHSDKIPPDVYS